MPAKANHLVALSYEDKLVGNFVPVSQVSLQSGAVIEVWNKGIGFPCPALRKRNLSY